MDRLFELVEAFAARLTGLKFDPETSLSDRHRGNLIGLYGIIGITIFSLFSVFRFLAGDVGGAVVDIIGVVSMLTLVFYLKRTGDVATSSKASILVLALIVLYYVYNPALSGGGVFWLFLMPSITIYLTGRKLGSRYMLLILLALLLIIILQLFNIVRTPHEDSFILVFWAALLFVSIITLFHQRSHESLFLDRTNALKKLNDQLFEKVTDLRESESQQTELSHEIDEKVKELTKKNEDLEQTKTAMLNLLDDNQQSKEKIELERAKDEALLGSLGEGLIAVDAQEKITVINQAAIDLLAIKPEEYYGVSIQELLDVRDDNNKVVDPNDRPIRIALKTEKTVTNTNFSYVNALKKKIPVAITAAPIVDQGAKLGAVMVFRDITKEKQIDRAKTEFVSLASHQLRTPLSASNWYVEMLLSEDAGKINNEQKDYLNEIHTGNQRLVKLVNSLLNVSRLELGTFIVDPKKIKLAKVIESVIKEVEPQAEKRKIKLKVVLDNNLEMMADDSLVEMIAQNLLTNAIKYSHEGGQVEVKLGVLGSTYQLSVSDHGIGIPKNQINKVFEKLFRADNVLKTDTDGTGLGLYIVKQVLKETGGEIKVKSTLNKGTTFTVGFPKTGMKKKEGSRRLMTSELSA